MYVCVLICRHSDIFQSRVLCRHSGIFQSRVLYYAHIISNVKLNVKFTWILFTMRDGVEHPTSYVEVS